MMTGLRYVTLFQRLLRIAVRQRPADALVLGMKWERWMSEQRWTDGEHHAR